MYYDHSPVRDSRYARRLVFLELSAFEENYWEAESRNDAGLRAASNSERENVQRQFDTLRDMRDELPQFDQQRIDQAL